MAEDTIDVTNLTPAQQLRVHQAERKLLLYFLRDYAKRLRKSGDGQFSLDTDAGLSDDDWPLVAVLVNRRRKPADREHALGSYSCATWEVVAWLRDLIDQVAL